MFRSKKGFSLVELMVAMVIMSIAMLTVAQTTSFIMKILKNSERKSSAFSETHDLLLYVRRTAKNISLSRLDLTRTYVNPTEGGSIRPVGANAVGFPKSSMTIPAKSWLQRANGNPFFAEANSAYSQTNAQLILDSFALEEHTLLKNPTENSLIKRTRRILVSRCDRWERDFSVATTPGSVAVTALYVLGVMDRRPFLKKQPGDTYSVNCCPVNAPNCTTSHAQYFFRSYAITLDNNRRVLSVEEFPKMNPDNPTIGTGFGLWFDSSTANSVAIKAFFVSSRCYQAAYSNNEACLLRDPKQFVKAAKDVRGILSVDTRSISTSVTNDIVNTGIISL